MTNKKIVQIIHAVDTEGPLYESTLAKFERLDDLLGIKGIQPTNENLEKIRRGELPLDGKEKDAINILNGHLTNYNDTWDKIDEMLSRLFDDKFRTKLLDSYGQGWIFNWHCLDHVGFEYNPRRRDMGYHNIYDHYKDYLKTNTNTKDAIHWHFHPMSTYKDAHRCATSFINSPELYQILTRRIIERNWFPTVFRAGFQTERPDSNWFLEQWIPFDISNMALDDPSEYENTTDFRNGRSGDWRRAPSDWSIYNPSHDDYQVPGNCRRTIGRALNVLNRIATIDQSEMNKAFKRANDELPTVVGMASHDFRDLEHEVDFIRNLITESSKLYPDVKFQFCEGVEGFQKAIWEDNIPKTKLNFEIIYNKASEKDVPNIEVKLLEGDVFGPQPFLAIETRSRRFIHDNFDFSIKGGSWHYAFHGDTLPIEDVARIGVAANDQYGNLCIKRLDFTTDKTPCPF